MKKLSKDEMKKVVGGQEEGVNSSADAPGCKGLTCTTSKECQQVNAGYCYPCTDGTYHCG